MMKMNLKRGKLNVDEVQFIRNNLDTMSDEEIGNHLKRSPALIAKHRNQEPEAAKQDDRNPIIAELHAKHFWSDIKKVLLATEISFFEQEWAKLIHQFQTNEIVATDESMIRDLIIEDILYFRVLKRRQYNMTEAGELQRQLEIEQAKPREQRNEAIEASLQTQIQALVASLPVLTTEQTKHAERKDAKLNQLKATRSARFKQIAESRKNFFELAKELDTRVNREKEGRWMELMRKGGEKVKKDWEELYEYADGTVDRPLLTPEAVLEEDEQGEEK
jgi:hypothetical protein